MKNRDIKVLFGINGMEEDDVKQFIKDLEKYDIFISSFECRYMKFGVGQYLDDNPDTDVAILSQYLESSSPYAGYDFEMLIENHENVNFIPILVEGSNNLVGDLFQLGIFNGLYANDANAAMISKMIKEGRGRKEAKVYYDIKETSDDMDLAALNKSADFIQNCDDEDIEKNALHVLHMVKPSEFRKILDLIEKDRYELLSATANKELQIFFKKDTVLKEAAKRTGLFDRFSFDRQPDENSEQNVSTLIKKGLFNIGTFIDKVINKSDDACEKTVPVSNSLSGILKNVQIGFAGTGKKTGVTYQAIISAHYLANNGYRVALFDVTGIKCNTYESIKKWQQVSNTGKASFEYMGVDYYKVGTPDNINIFLNEMLTNNYNFIIIDYGIANKNVMDDIGRCTDRYLIAASNPWERGSLIAFCKENKKYIKNFNVMIRGVSNNEREDIDWLSNITDEPLFIDTVENPFSGEAYDSLKIAFKDYVAIEGDNGQPVAKSGKKKAVVKKEDKKVKLVGTETIFVTSLKHGTGKTHFSVAIANRLVKNGRVCLISDNRTFLYNTLDEDVIVYDDIYSAEDINTANYVIFDCGNIEDLSDEEVAEFQRANKKVIMCWPGEDFFCNLADYLLQYEDNELDDWTFVFNNVADSQMKEVKRVMSSYNSCYIPIFESDNLPREVRRIINNIV